MIVFVITPVQVENLSSERLYGLVIATENSGR